MSITPEQIKAARRLLGWRQFQLASSVKISLNTMAYIETGRKAARASTLERIKKVLETAGVEFTDETEGGAGVRLRNPAPPAIAVENLNASNDE